MRLQTLIDSDEIPDPDEAVLVALVDAFGLFDELFSPDELTRRRPRIEAMALIITPASFLGARASGPRAGGTPALPGRAPGGIMIEAEAITRLDLIGREVTRTIRQVARAVHL